MKVVVHKIIFSSWGRGQFLEVCRKSFGIEVKNLGRNWEAETGTVATLDLEKFPRS